MQANRRPWAVVPVALGGLMLSLAAVVAVVADDLPLRGPRQRGAKAWDLSFLSDAVAPVSALLMLLGAAMFVVMLGGRRRHEEDRLAAAGSQAVAFAFLILLLWAASRRPPHLASESAVPRSEPVAAATATSAAPRPAPERAGGAGRSVAPIVGLVALAAVSTAVAVAAVARARRPAFAPTDDRDATGTARAVDAAIDDLATDPDPRRAVVRAYGALLAGLERAGQARLASEAPVEYVTRVLGAARVRPVPLQRLTALFEEARFSEHPVGEAHRESAIAALREARLDLVAPEGAHA